MPTPTESIYGATLNSITGQIVDASGNIWTLYDDSAAGMGLIVYKNGAPAGFTENVIQMVYKTHTVYQMNINDDWWSWTAGAWLACPTPLVGFWGVNGHITWNWTLAACYEKPNWPTIITKLQDLGMNTFRNGFDLYSASVFQDFINNYATPAGIIVTPVLLGDEGDDPVTAYSTGFTLGQTAATALTGLVPWFEVGNELDQDCILPGVNGTLPTDYDNTYYPVCREWIRGMLAGIKSVDTTTPIMMSGITWIHSGFLDMLLAGTQPDGTTGHPVVTWDITACHWYTNNNTSNDNIENAAGFNLLAHLATYGKPIQVNEYGANYSQYSSNETHVTNALIGADLMAKWVAVKATYGIQATSMYQLMDSAAQGTPTSSDEMHFGLVQNNGSTNRARYSHVKSYIVANPE